MKQKLVLYRLTTFILLPIAGLLGLNLLFTLPAIFSNPPLLLGAFILFAIVAYVISSFIFFLQGVQNNKPLKQGLKDFVRVNAFITIAFAVFSLLGAVSYFSVMQNVSADDLARLQKNMGPAFDGMTKDAFLRLLKELFIILAVLGVMLLYHTIATFRLLKQYASLFVTGGSNNE